MGIDNTFPVLVVEDDAVIRDLVVECLQEHGYEVVGAATAEEAMQHLAGAPAPLLAVTDIDLGVGRSGIEFADWLHGQWPDLNVIFASGRLDRLNGRAFDPRETCLGKPFSLASLIERVRNAQASSTAGSALTGLSSLWFSRTARAPKRMQKSGGTLQRRQV